MRRFGLLSLYSGLVIVIAALVVVPFLAAEPPEPPDDPLQCEWGWDFQWEFVVNQRIEAGWYYTKWPCGYAQVFMWITQYDEDDLQIREWFGDLEEDEERSEWIDPDCAYIILRGTSTSCGCGLPTLGCGSCARDPSKELRIDIPWH